MATPLYKRLKDRGTSFYAFPSAASDLKYLKETKRIINEMMTSPNDEIVKIFAKIIY